MFGLARNAHMALVYRGPQEFRTHTFQFEFWPKTVDETETVKTIINDFQQGSTPRMGVTMGDVNKLTFPYFHAPRQWEIKFCKGRTIASDRAAQAVTGAGGTNPYLFQIGRSVITTMTINHDPDGVVGFHSDGHPVHTRLAVTFQELEYVINEVDPVSDAHKNNVRKIEATARKEAIQANIKTGGGGAPLNT